MANLADCAIAIAKSDIEKLGTAITRADKNLNGTEQKYRWKIKKGDEIKDVVFYAKYMFTTRNHEYKEEIYYEVDGEKITQDEYDNTYGYPNGWGVDYDTHKTLIDKNYNNGWCVNWVKLKSYSYQSDTYVQEYDDHITIYFGGRWDFPTELDDFLNGKDIEWQGAVAEDGCEVYCDELGTTDFNLRIRKEEDDDGYVSHCVEDTSTN